MSFTLINVYFLLQKKRRIFEITSMRDLKSHGRFLEASPSQIYSKRSQVNKRISLQEIPTEGIHNHRSFP